MPTDSNTNSSLHYHDFELVDQTQVLQTLPLPEQPLTSKSQKYPPLAQSEKLRRNVLAQKHRSVVDQDTNKGDQIYFLKGYTDDQAILSSQRDITNSKQKLDLVGSLQPLKRKKVKSKRRLSKVTHSIFHDSQPYLQDLTSTRQRRNQQPYS